MRRTEREERNTSNLIQKGGLEREKRDTRLVLSFPYKSSDQEGRSRAPVTDPCRMIAPQDSNILGRYELLEEDLSRETLKRTLEYRERKEPLSYSQKPP